MRTKALKERRRKIRFPVRGSLLCRVPSMEDYEPCRVTNVSTLSLEILPERPLELRLGAMMTILVHRKGSSQKHYRLLGSITRRERKGSRWQYVVSAPKHRPWSAMLIYDVASALETEDLQGGCVRRSTGTENETSGAGASSPDEPEHLPDVLFAGSIDEGDPVTGGLLARFSPFNELNDSLRAFLARGLTIAKRHAGRILVERGSRDDASFYLVEGTLILEAADGHKEYVVGGTPRTRFPICTLRPHMYSAITATDVAIIPFDREMVREVTGIVSKYRNGTGIELTEIPLDPSENAPEAP